jgi:ethanolamine ammonia-lyase large subunit
MPEQFSFNDLRELFAKSNEEKSGDRLAGIAAGSERERIAARRKLADLSIDEIVRQPLIDPDNDDGAVRPSSGSSVKESVDSQDEASVCHPCR